MEEILRALDAGDPEERRHAIARLPELRGEERARLLLRGLGDPDWRVRKEAASVAISMAPDPAVLHALMSALAPGDNVGLRNAAVEALGGFGSAAVGALGAALPSLDADGRKLAIDALAHAADPSTVDVLATTLTDSDPNVRAAATEALSIVGSACIEKAGPLLKSRLQTTSAYETLVALEGINRLGLVVDWEDLKGLLEHPLLQRAALVAAGRCGHVDAAPYLVEALENAHGSAWSAALMALAEFVAGVGDHVAAARAALSRLGESTRRRLAERAGARQEGLEEQKAALLVMGALGTTQAADAVIAALADDRVAAEAEAALSMLGPAAILALAARARSEEANERAACIELLGRMADESTLAIARQAIHDAADDASPDVVRAALVALTRLGDARSVGIAVRWLAPDAPVRVQHAAATALAVCAARHPEAAKALARQARPDQPNAIVAAIVIGAIDGPVFGSTTRDAEFLSVAASNESAFVRRAALDALAELDTESAVDAVAFALTDEAPEVQLSAARALGKMRDASGRSVGVERLIEVVRESQDDALVAAAVEALGDAGDPAALDVLSWVAREGNPMRAVVAVEAIGRLSSADEIASALLELLGHAEPEVVKAALRAVSADTEASIEGHLARALEHGAWDVRRLAADILGSRASTSAKKLLQDRLAVEEEPLVREAIQRSLAELDGGVTVRRTYPPPAEGESE